MCFLKQKAMAIDSINKIEQIDKASKYDTLKSNQSASRTKAKSFQARWLVQKIWVTHLLLHLLDTRQPPFDWVTF